MNIPAGELGSLVFDQRRAYGEVEWELEESFPLHSMSGTEVGIQRVQ